MTAEDRAERTRAADELAVRAFGQADCPSTGVALIAVGGYGRSELAPFSDLDLILVHDDAIEPGAWAADLWYPLWDSGRKVDHSVRSLGEVAAQASADLRVALGLLDARHLAGDPNITLRLRTDLHAQWRRDARSRLGELNRLVSGRAELLGELAHSAIPDLKDSVGGLRDATVLKGLVATWLVDVPHAELERARTALLDVRDALQAVAGRATDRVTPEYWPDLAESLGVGDTTQTQRYVRAMGRRITHLSRLTWRRVDQVMARSKVGDARRPALETIARGVAISRGEVVLDRRANLNDPSLLLRAATEAAERQAVLALTSVARVVAECPALPDPWPDEARDLFVRLLAAPGLLDVWETLDETGALESVLPEWEQVRLLPHASAVHRFTVDRHLVETCREAGRLIRRVQRADVLMVAALLHDIGKGGLTEHCVAGEPIARKIAARMGYDAREVDLIGHLVRWHLLLPELATTRDPDDPATVAEVLAKIPDREELELLAALTEADARATSEKAWTTWRAGLIGGLVRRSAAAFSDEAPTEASYPKVQVPRHIRRHPSQIAVTVRPSADGSLVTVMSGDRVGLLADAAAMLAMQRIPVRSARAWTVHEVGISEWQVAVDGLDERVLRERLEAIIEGRLDARSRLTRPTASALEPAVAVRPEASARATVLEVRAEDRPNVVYTVLRALADMGLSVRSAHVSTWGPQARDVFYVQEASAGALSDQRSADAAHEVRSALRRPGIFRP